MARLKVGRGVPALVLAITLSVLAGVGIWSAHLLNQSLHDQIISREGRILYAVAARQEFAQSVKAPLDDSELLQVALQICDINEDVLAVRIFGTNGHFILGVPVAVQEESLREWEFNDLQQFRPTTRYEPSALFSDVFMSHGSNSNRRVPLLFVTLPIHPKGKQQYLGCAQLVIDGRPLEQEFAETTKNLTVQTLGIFGVAAAILLSVLSWAYRNLRRAQEVLEERTARLLRANHELCLTAKTKALGAVTAHLVHGLTNPLATLQRYMSNAGRENPDLEGARASAQRMQELVEETVRLLAEENGADRYELTLKELADVLANKLRPLAKAQGVPIKVRHHGSRQLSNHQANLVLLILENLAQNAIQAGRPGAPVAIDCRASEDRIVCEVQDHGPGIPRELQSRLFTPCRSSKPGGNGIGLAISQQLAVHLGGHLELVRTGPDGSLFRLDFPLHGPALEAAADFGSPYALRP